MIDGSRRAEMSNSSNNGKASSKLGRKGDPRMHRAVAARLANPDLTLFEALRMGGFDYPTNDDASVMDSEKVTLGQRKNQLSRRLRLARKSGNDGGSQHSNSSTEFAGATSTPGPPGLSSEAQKELEKLMQHSRHVGKVGNATTQGSNLKRDVSDLGLSDDDVDAEPPNMDLQQNEEPKRARMAKFHPDYAPLFVPPSSSVRNSFGSATGNSAPSAKAPGNSQQGYQQGFSQSQHQLSSLAPGAGLGAANGGMSSLQMGTSTSLSSAMGANGFQPASLFQQPMTMFPSQQSQAARPSSVAIASLSATASAVGMTLEQLAVALGSSTTKLAKVLTDNSGADALAKQQELALHLYQAESRSLYSKCMLLAGIDPRQCQESSQGYLQFALSAWQQEGKRLHDMMGQSRGGEAPFNFDGGSTKKTKRSSSCSTASKNSRSSPAQGPEASRDHSHSHNHDKESDDDECANDGNDGRHIHRLEGSKVECYHGIEPLGKNSNSLWPSKYRCEDLEGSCSNKCASSSSRITQTTTKLSSSKANMEPKIINLSEINLADPEWNIDLNGSIDGSVVGLFKLGERGDDNMVASL